MALDPHHVAAVVRRVVHTSCMDHNELAERTIDLDAGDDAPLFGVERVLDSLALVGLLVAVEQGIDDALGVTVTLADAKAASRATSPFRTVGSLIAYAAERTLEEAAVDG